jgi:hypothetical protein
MTQGTVIYYDEHVWSIQPKKNSKNNQRHSVSEYPVSRHYNANIAAHEELPQANSSAQRTYICSRYTCTLVRSSHELRRRSLLPRRFDEYTSLRFSALSTSAASAVAPIPCRHALVHGPIDDDQGQHPHSFGDVRHSMFDTTSWIVPEKEPGADGRINLLLFSLCFADVLYSTYCLHMRVVFVTIGERLQPTIDAAETRP